MHCELVQRQPMVRTAQERVSMNRYEPSEDKKIYEKCIGIARKVDNFVFTVENGNFFLSYGDPEKKMQMDRVLFFKLDTNEIINLLLKR